MAKIDFTEYDAARIACLEKNYRMIGARLHALERWVEVFGSTPWWKRLWFVMQGYRPRRLGVWYRARWNGDGHGY